MKTNLVFSTVILLILSACGDSTEPVGFPTDARNFMFAGNAGTEIVFVRTTTFVDTNGRIVISQDDTTRRTILQRDVLHPTGGLSVLVRSERKLGTDSIPYQLDTTYYSFYKDAFVYFRSTSQTNPDILIKNPLSIGTSCVAPGNDTVTIKAIDEVINTLYKPLKTVRLEKKEIDVVSKQIRYITKNKYYYAPDIGFVRFEESIQTIYPSSAMSTQTQVLDIVSYTKK